MGEIVHSFDDFYHIINVKNHWSREADEAIYIYLRDYAKMYHENIELDPEEFQTDFSEINLEKALLLARIPAPTTDVEKNNLESYFREHNPTWVDETAVGFLRNGNIVIGH